VDRFDQRRLVQRDAALGHVLRVIADPLDLGRDAQSRNDGAQIVRQRLAPSEQFDRQIIDLGAHRVQLSVVLHHLGGKIAVAAHDGFDGTGQLLLRQAAHLHDQGGEPAQFVVEALDYVLSGHLLPRLAQPKRPVM
jgi:hypothetical protein